MASISVTIPHSLSSSVAKKRIRDAITQGKKDYAAYAKDVEETWVGNTGTITAVVRGTTLEGSVIVYTDRVEIGGELPFIFSFIKGKIEKIITQNAKKILK